MVKNKKITKRKITKRKITKRKITNRKITKRIYKNKQHGGYWRMHVPSNTGTDPSFTVLIDDVIALIASSVNTMIDTVEFIKNVSTFKSDMGSEWHSSQSPGA
tara:strand:+ start:1471 stop:1779 length:309 start_codon:yes stop_codon:yes gene_type:complete